jgi:formylglycine-generating enzyme required for sulfatase activity
VTLTRAFHLGQHEVTNHEYMEALQWAYDRGYVAATTALVRDNLDGNNQTLLNLGSPYCEIRFSDATHTFSLRQSPSSEAQNAYPEGYDPAYHPVKTVTWHGAARYCDWLSLREGLPRAYEYCGGNSWSCNNGDPYGAAGYRLPTDAEWEYAAQYDDERIYPWGDEATNCSRANYSGCVGWTSPVGSRPGGDSQVGFSDLAGNLWEWCNDWQVCDLGTAPVTDPVGPSSGSTRGVRGSSWEQASTSYQRCANRYMNYTPGTERNYLGFRVARTANP